MNIFYLDQDPETAARYHCDKHVVKMILETAQILSTAHHYLDGRFFHQTPQYQTIKPFIYEKTHHHHPCSAWARETVGNYEWCFALLTKLLAEYEFRYGRQHKTGNLVPHLKHYPVNIPKGSMTPPVQCMPDNFKHENPIVAYRQYYIGKKAHIAKWKKREVPKWFKKDAA